MYTLLALWFFLYLCFHARPALAGDHSNAVQMAGEKYGESLLGWKQDLTPPSGFCKPVRVARLLWKKLVWMSHLSWEISNICIVSRSRPMQVKIPNKVYFRSLKVSIYFCLSLGSSLVRGIDHPIVTVWEVQSYLHVRIALWSCRDMFLPLSV